MVSVVVDRVIVDIMLTWVASWLQAELIILAGKVERADGVLTDEEDDC